MYFIMHVPMQRLIIPEMCIRDRRCIKCGEIFDVDMDQIPDLLERIHNTHGIEFVDYDISFKGICPKCREKVKEEQYG